MKIQSQHQSHLKENTKYTQYTGGLFIIQKISEVQCSLGKAILDTEDLLLLATAKSEKHKA